MYCYKCGKQIPENCIFCPYCGEKQNQENENSNQNIIEENFDNCEEEYDENQENEEYLNDDGDTEVINPDFFTDEGYIVGIRYIFEKNIFTHFTTEYDMLDSYDGFHLLSEDGILQFSYNPVVFCLKIINDMNLFESRFFVQHKELREIGYKTGRKELHFKTECYPNDMKVITVEGFSIFSQHKELEYIISRLEIYVRGMLSKALVVNKYDEEQKSLVIDLYNNFYKYIVGNPVRGMVLFMKENVNIYSQIILTAGYKEYFKNKVANQQKD